MLIARAAGRMYERYVEDGHDWRLRQQHCVLADPLPPDDPQLRYHSRQSL